MPAVKIIRNLTTRPFASDDMHIVCVVLGVYLTIQIICLIPLALLSWYGQLKGTSTVVNGVPTWCEGYPRLNYTSYVENGLPVFKDELKIEYHQEWKLATFIGNAIAYFIISLAWIGMTWSSASIGTPTEPFRRDMYIRNLILFKMFVCNLYPIVMVVLGIWAVYDLRHNNYGCGEDGNPTVYPDENAAYGFFCALMVTYALELLIWPAIIVNKVIRVLRVNRFWNRGRVEGRGGKAERFERKLGCCLKTLSCIARGKAGGGELKNKGELKDFASHLMCLLNNEAKFDFVLTDIYFGMRMLSLIQAEDKVDAIKKMAAKNKLLKRQLLKKGECGSGEEEFSQPPKSLVDSENSENPKLLRRSSIFVLGMCHNAYEVCERAVLQENNSFDQTVMSDGAHFAKYASCIYFKVRDCVIDDFAEEQEEEETFVRELHTLFCDDFRLTSIDLGHAMLCYANFVNGIVSTPYAICVDDEMKKIVLTVRGTKSLEDLVVDLQFIPESLERVGHICGFKGDGHYCHKGFLARSKWIYNDIKKTKVLKTLYSEQSPFNDYPLVICGHSLGAGCAIILSLMLRPSFPSLQCFAFEPPGCVFDEEISAVCDEFVISFVRHDDLVPRLSYHNLETLRDEFFDAFARIKVPKIKLFYHLRTPYSERFVALRNSKVLRPKEQIPTDTRFWQQRIQFNNEREDKNSDKIQLFIPGKIVHLVDTSGSGNYIPYWAERGEFAQLEISKRMLSDHGIHELPEILSDTRLGGANTVSLAFHNAPLIYTDDEDVSEADVRLFSCCSNPYGKLPIVLALLGLVASALENTAASDCDFFRATFDPMVDGFNGNVTMRFGIYSFGIHDCSNSTGPCDRAEDFTDQCVTYPPDFVVDGYLLASRAFLFLASLIAILANFMVYVSMCWIFKERVWAVITAMYLLTTLFGGLGLIFKRELVWCDEPLVSCHIGTNASMQILACCMYFLLAVGSGYLAKTGKRSDVDGGECETNGSSYPTTLSRNTSTQATSWQLEDRH